MDYFYICFRPANPVAEEVILTMQNNATFNGSINVSAEYNDTRLPFTAASIAISASILLPLSAFGIITNFVTIVVIVCSKKLKSIFNCLILSLCISDLVSAMISPFFLYRRTWGFTYWEISSFLCKVYLGTDTMTSYVTTLHILSFAVLRLISIRAPTFYYKLKLIHAKVIVVTVWILCFFVGFIPLTLMATVRTWQINNTRIDSKWPSCTLCLDWFSTFRRYSAVGFSIMYYLPILLVIIISISIISLLFKRRTKRQTIISFHPSTKGQPDTAESKRRRKESHVVLQLSLIVGSFLLGYIPHTAYYFYTVASKGTTYDHKVFDWWFAMIQHTCLRISESLNPVFYNLASSIMRKETAFLFKRLWKSIVGRNQSSVIMRTIRSRKISPAIATTPVKIVKTKNCFTENA